MASPQFEMKAKRRRDRESAATNNMIVKEGFLCKKGGVIKSWSRRYFVLNHQCLCYFKREVNGVEDAGLQPMGRVFLSDVVNIETESVEKKKAFVFALHTKKRGMLLQASNKEDRQKWVEAVKHALDSDSKAEREDPFRKTLRRLKPGLKRVTLVKDPVKGIGCTIKSAAGHVVVNRIIEDGPIALTGVLRPGDEILDIHGTAVTGMQVSEVVEVIKQVPDQFLATVRPLTSVSKNKPIDTRSVLYSEIKVSDFVPVATKQAIPIPEILISREEARAQPKFDSSPTPSLDDVGYYDDEDDGDIPPPLPPRTEDALVILDSPPLPLDVDEDVSRPPLPPKPRHNGPEDITHSHHLPTAAGMRPALHKSKSEDLIANKVGTTKDEVMGVNKSPRLPRRHHVYEEVQPMLQYMDINKLDFTSSGSKTDSLVKVELDWKHKVRV